MLISELRERDDFDPDDFLYNDDYGVTCIAFRSELTEAIRGGDRTHLRIVLDRWLPGAGVMI